MKKYHYIKSLAVILFLVDHIRLIYPKTSIIAIFTRPSYFIFASLIGTHEIRNKRIIKIGTLGIILLIIVHSLNIDVHPVLFELAICKISQKIFSNKQMFLIGAICPFIINNNLFGYRLISFMCVANMKINSTVSWLITLILYSIYSAKARQENIGQIFVIILSLVASYFLLERDLNQELPNNKLVRFLSKYSLELYFFNIIVIVMFIYLQRLSWLS